MFFPIKFGVKCYFFKLQEKINVIIPKKNVYIC